MGVCLTVIFFWFGKFGVGIWAEMTDINPFDAFLKVLPYASQKVKGLRTFVPPSAPSLTSSSLSEDAPKSSSSRNPYAAMPTLWLLHMMFLHSPVRYAHSLEMAHHMT